MTRKPKDLTNQRFSLLTAKSFAFTRGGHAFWICKCDCGGQALYQAHTLKKYARGCKECRNARNAASKTAHGHSGSRRDGNKPVPTPEYNSYTAAKKRCNPNNASFRKRYAGRGIEFRFESFEQFLAEIGPRPKGKTLDRINNEGHYEPGNIRWATPKEQQANRTKREPCDHWYPTAGSACVKCGKFYRGAL